MPKHKVPRYFNISFCLRDIPLADEEYVSPFALARALQDVITTYLLTQQEGVTLRGMPRIEKILTPVRRGNTVPTKR